MQAILFNSQNLTKRESLFPDSLRILSELDQDQHKIHLSPDQIPGLNNDLITMNKRQRTSLRFFPNMNFSGRQNFPRSVGCFYD